MSLQPIDQRRIDAAVKNGASVRGAARETGLNYGAVRGYLAKRQVPTIAPPPPGEPAVLLYDIETAPALAWMWSAYDANVIAIEKDWYLLSVAYRWLGSDDTYFVSIYQDPKFYPDTQDDLYLAERIKLLFDAADVLVAHNGDRFDQRKVNARLLWHDLGPASPYKTVDTAKQARRYFANYMNSLKDLGRLYNLGSKLENEGFSLWRKCMAGDPAAWATMEAYNRQDIEVMEKLYLKLRPWMQGAGAAPNPNFQSETPVCTHCGSDKLQKRGVRTTSVSTFQTYQCGDCKGYSRSRLSDRDALKPGLVP